MPVKDPVILRAMCITNSWAQSWGLKVKVKSNKLYVEGVPVVFGRLRPKGCIALDPTLVNDQDLNIVMSELRRLCKKVGLPKVPDLQRQPAEVRAAEGDYEARAMRLTALSKAPNPPEEVLEYWKRRVVKREADIASRKYHELAEVMLYTEQDFLNLGLTYTTVYLHRKGDITNHERAGGLLTRYLRQEYARWAKVTGKDLRNVIPDSRGISVADVMGSPVPGAVLTAGYYTIPEYKEPEVEEPERDQNFYEDRRLDAKGKLAASLASLSHDSMVEALGEAINNHFLDVPTRELAERMFREHARNCVACKDAWEAWSSVKSWRHSFVRDEENSCARRQATLREVRA